MRSAVLVTLSLFLSGCSAAQTPPAGGAASGAETDAGTGAETGTGTEADAGTGTGTEAGPDAGRPRPPLRPPLLFGLVEEQLAICYGTTYPCSDIGDDDVRRGWIARLAPGMVVRWGGYETERTGLGYTGEAARRAFENVANAGGQLDPAWLASRAKEAGYGSWILAIPVTTSIPQAFGGTAHEWSVSDATSNMDAWKQVVDGGFPPPSYIELGNEPWNYSPEGVPDGFQQHAADYVAKAQPIGEAVAQKIASFGWPTRVAAVVDDWPGTDFETPGYAAQFPSETIAMARSIAKQLGVAPVLQTHAYPLHGGWWCPQPGTADTSDVACAYALYTMVRAIKQLAPGADVIVTEDNYDSNAYPRSGVYTTLAALLTFAAGGVAYTEFGNNNYSHTGDRYELFVGTDPVPLLQNDIARLQSLVSGLRSGDVSLQSATGSIAITAGGYMSLVDAKTAPDPAYASGTAPTHYVFRVGAKTVTVDLVALTVSVQ